MPVKIYNGIPVESEASDVDAMSLTYDRPTLTVVVYYVPQE